MKQSLMITAWASLLIALAGPALAAMATPSTPTSLPVTAHAVGDQLKPRYGILYEFSNVERQFKEEGVLIIHRSASAATVDRRIFGSGSTTTRLRVLSDGRLFAPQFAEVDSAFNSAVLVARTFPKHPRTGDHWMIPVTYRPENYPPITMNLEVVVDSDADGLVHVIGEGSRPGARMLDGRDQPVSLLGRLDMKFKNGFILESAASISSHTMNQLELPVVRAWTIKAY